MIGRTKENEEDVVITKKTNNTDTALNKQEERKKKILNLMDESGGYNPQPVKCDSCSGELDTVMHGVYRCKDCGKMVYDNCHKISNFLKENGPSSKLQIMSETGMSLAAINYFFREGKFDALNIQSSKPKCRSCGTAIEIGLYCARCSCIERRERVF